MIAIVDYGMGNLGSLANMIRNVGGECVITSNHNEILNSDKTILPGVGSFDAAMDRINENGLIDVLRKVACEAKKPFLGVCLGMQLLTNSSEEGQLDGLGFIDGETIKFRHSSSVYKTPHMGWNHVEIENKSVLTDNLPTRSKFYFVHSYYVKVKNSNNSILKTNYDIAFSSAIQKNNIFGVQFHPEKSHKYGKILIRNFVEMT